MKNKAFYSFLLALVLIFSLVTPAAVATGVDTDDFTPTPEITTVVEDTAPVSPVADVEAAPTATPASVDPTDTPAASTATPEAAAEPTDSAEPSVEPSAEPTDSAEPSVEPSAEPTDSAEPTPSVEPTATVAPAETTAVTVEYVQGLIDALPDADAINDENRADVEAQLTAIDDAKCLLTQEQRDTLDFARYGAAISALGEGDEPTTLDGAGEFGLTITQREPVACFEKSITFDLNWSGDTTAIDVSKLTYSSDYLTELTEKYTTISFAPTDGTLPTTLTLARSTITGFQLASILSRTVAQVEYDGNVLASVTCKDLSFKAILPTTSPTAGFAVEGYGGRVEYEPVPTGYVPMWNNVDDTSVLKSALYGLIDNEAYRLAIMPMPEVKAGEYSFTVVQETKPDKFVKVSGGILSVMTLDEAIAKNLVNHVLSLYVVRNDSDGNPKAGVQYGIYKEADCSGTPVVTFTTGADGRADITTKDFKSADLPSASGTTYYLRELNGGMIWTLTGKGEIKNMRVDDTTYGSESLNMSLNYSGESSGDGWVYSSASPSPNTLTINGAKYAVTYSGGKYGTGSIASAEKKEDVDLTLSGASFTREGHTQVGWALTDGGAKAYDLGGTYKENKQQTFYPVWQADNCTVTWDANGGTLDTTGATHGEVATGTAIVAPTATRAADAQYTYTFDGWYLVGEDGTETKVTDFGTATANVTYKAHWTPTLRQYTVTWDANGGTLDTTGATGTADYGTAITPPTTNPTKTDAQYTYTFDGWYDAQSGGNKVTASTTITGNVTYYAHWTQGAVRQYTLSFNSNGGTDVSPITADYGTVIDVSNIKPYCYGCIFTGWYTDATFKTRVTGVTLTQETTLVAGWVLNTYVGPHTGDDSNFALWLALLAFSTAALTTTATVLKKKRKG